MDHTSPACFRIVAGSLAGARWAAFWTACAFALIFSGIAPGALVMAIPLTYGISLVAWFGGMIVVLTWGVALIPRRWQSSVTVWAATIGLSAAVVTALFAWFSPGAIGSVLRLIDVPLGPGLTSGAAPFLLGLIGLWSGVAAGRGLLSTT